MNLRKAIQANIDTYGHHVMGVGAGPDTPSFAYTIGLTGRFDVELLIFALPMTVACGFLNQIVEQGLQLDEPYTTIANFPLYLRLCTKPTEQYVAQANAFYGREVKIAQVVLCDRAGVYPWQAGFDHKFMNPIQPLLFDTRLQ